MPTRKQKQKQQRGGGFAFDTVAGVSTGGVPFESRTAYDHCYPEARVAPSVAAVGAMQRGGGCGCMAAPPMQMGGGGGSGGYGFALDNSLGKVYTDLPRGTCPGQAGGSYGLVSFPAGYGYDTKSAVLSDSAHYLDPVSYGKTCGGAVGGARKVKKSKKSKKTKKTKKSKKTRNVSRKH
jgi:hypothetical protein